MAKIQKKPSDEFTVVAPFTWDEQRSRAAIGLASGKSWQATADEVGVSKRTIANWCLHEDFGAEVDRLSLMVDVASRAARLRIAMRVVRQCIGEDKIETSKDVLEWLKFAQSETDGVKLDLGKLSAAFGADETPVADSGSDRSGIPAEGEAVH